MKFLSVTGPKDDIDRVIDQYLSKYDIQLETRDAVRERSVRIKNRIQLKTIYGDQPL